MEKVYDEQGGYTTDASAIDKVVKENMRELIRNELDAGTPIEALEYVVCNAIRTEILSQNLRIRLGKPMID